MMTTHSEEIQRLYVLQERAVRQLRIVNETLSQLSDAIKVLQGEPTLIAVPSPTYKERRDAILKQLEDIRCDLPHGV